MLRLRKDQFIGESELRVEAGGFSLNLVSSAMPEAAIEPHRHDEAHFVLLLSGAYISSARGAPDLACTPMLIFNPANVSHHDRCLGPGRFLALTISVPCAHLLHEVQPESREPFVLRDAYAFSAAFKLVVETSRKRRNGALALEGLAWQLLDSLGASAPDKPGCPPRWLWVAHEMIWTPDRAPKNTREVADYIGVHPVHLARMYRRYLGCAPGEILRGRRLERAATLLGRSRETLAQVAADSGFADQSHLSRAFRTACGMTPRGYRRRESGVARVQEVAARHM